MSREAMEWALETPTGDPTRSLVLVAIGKYAQPNGAGAWASPETLAVYSECSARTVQRHIAVLIDGGLIREGDQSIIPDHIPKRRRPIVYDLAMDLETAREWASVEQSGRRALAAAVGAAAGRKGASRRAAVRSGADTRGDTHDTPPTQEAGVTDDTSSSWGDTHDTPVDTPRQAPRGDRWGDTRGVTGDTQTREEPKNKSKTQNLGGGKPRAPKEPKPNTDPTEAEARSLVKAYMDWWTKEKGAPILKSSEMYHALVKSYVIPALQAGHESAHIRSCLAASARAGYEWPTESAWRQLIDGRPIAHVNGNGSRRPSKDDEIRDAFARAAQMRAQQEPQVQAEIAM